MDSDQKFWLGIWTAITMAFIVLCLSFAIPCYQFNALYFEAMNHCADVGGTFQPFGWGQCIRGAK